MGMLGGLIVGIVGFVIAFLINWIPLDKFIKVIPICWIPKVDCSKWYDKVKVYLVVFLITLVVFFIPMV